MSEKIETLQIKLREAVQKARRFETEFNSLQYRINKWKDLLTKFVNDSESLFKNDEGVIW
jgi:hypothetical protein